MLENPTHISQESHIPVEEAGADEGKRKCRTSRVGVLKLTVNSSVGTETVFFITTPITVTHLSICLSHIYLIIIHLYYFCLM
jgi:hypothetical protein